MICKQCGGSLVIAPNGGGYDFISLKHEEILIPPVAEAGAFRVVKDAGVFCSENCLIGYLMDGKEKANG